MTEIQYHAMTGIDAATVLARVLARPSSTRKRGSNYMLLVRFRVQAPVYRVHVNGIACSGSEKVVRCFPAVPRRDSVTGNGNLPNSRI